MAIRQDAYRVQLIFRLQGVLCFDAFSHVAVAPLQFRHVAYPLESLILHICSAHTFEEFWLMLYVIPV